MAVVTDDLDLDAIAKRAEQAREYAAVDDVPEEVDRTVVLLWLRRYAADIDALLARCREAEAEVRTLDTSLRGTEAEVARLREMLHETEAELAGERNEAAYWEHVATKPGQEWHGAEGPGCGRSG